MRAKVGHGPLSTSNSLPHKERTKWTAFQPETYPKEDTSAKGAHKALLDGFLSSCKAEGRSEQVIRGLRIRVPKLFAYLQESSLDLFSLKIRDAQGYIGWLSAQRSLGSGALYNASTVASHFAVAARFYEYLRRRGLAVTNPFKEVRRVRVGKRIPRGLLKEAEMERLLDELGRFDEPHHLKEALSRYKAHVACELMYATGLRVSEVASLRVEDIDFSRGMIEVRRAKGCYSRVAYLNDYAREVLRLYVEKLRVLVSSEWNARNGGLLFATSWERFGHALNCELAKTCRELELPPMRSHGFRHALGYHLLRSGCSVRHIQSILGHRRLRSTEIYTKVDKEDLRAVVDTCHPRKLHGCT